MTSDAKQALKETVRSLRGRLLADLHNATESAWQMGARVQNTDVERRGAGELFAQGGVDVGDLVGEGAARAAGGRGGDIAAGREHVRSLH